MALTVMGAAMAIGPFAAAQIAPGRSGTSTMQYLGREEAWSSVATFGRCYARQNWRGAFELLGTEPGSRAELETYRRLFRSHNQSCLADVTELRAPHTMVRGAIAEGLYRRGYAVPPSLLLAAPAEGASIRTFSEAARCYAATHRSQIHALIMQTNPGSRQEFDAVREIMPEFARCLPDHARGAQFNATDIRFRLAEALVRLGLQPAASTQP